MAIERRTATGSTLRLDDGTRAAMEAARVVHVLPFASAEYATYFAVVPSVDQPVIVLLPASRDRITDKGWQLLQAAFAEAFERSMED